MFNIFKFLGHIQVGSEFLRTSFVSKVATMLYLLLQSQGFG
jgi:hypothetical protein